jgi:hypothetical protein
VKCGCFDKKEDKCCEKGKKAEECTPEQVKTCHGEKKGCC